MKISCVFLLGINLCLAQIALNEFLIDAADENTGEFLEIINVSADTLYPHLFYFCDAQDTDRIISRNDSLLPPGAYGLILDPDYSGEYNTYFPDTLYTFTIDDSKFGKYGISNSSSKQFSILGPDLQIIDTYETGNPFFPKAAFTMERVFPSENVWMQSSFAVGTPGLKNSCYPPETDVSLKLADIVNFAGHSTLSYIIRNEGIKPVSNFSLAVYRELPGYFDTLITIDDRHLSRHDSCLCIVDIPHIMYGGCPIFTRLSTKNDSYPHNNCCDSLTYSHIPYNAIILTEFLSRTGDDHPVEYIEYQSNTDSVVSLLGTWLFDLTSLTRCYDTLYVFPDSLLVLTESDNFHHTYPHVDNFFVFPDWPSLNNDEDMIGIKDAQGSVISGIHYNSSWNIQKNTPHELISPLLDQNLAESWISRETGSPGKKNDFRSHLKNLTLIPQAGPYIYPDPITLLFLNNGLLAIAQTSILINIDNSSFTFALPRSQPGDSLSCTISISNTLPEGLHRGVITYPELSENPADSFFIYKPYSDSPLRFNEFLADPDPDRSHAEFIELSSSTPFMDSRFWTLQINNNSCSLPKNINSLFPVFTSRPDIFSIPESLNFDSLPLPPLPNDGAVVLLRDPAGIVQDSVNLSEISCPLQGVSLEKRYESAPSSSPENWTASIHPQGMTPGLKNSVSATITEADFVTIVPEIFDSAIHDYIRFEFHDDVGISYLQIKIFDIRGHPVAELEQNTFSQQDPVIIWYPSDASGNAFHKGIYPVVIHETNCLGGHKKFRTLAIIYQ